MRDLNGNVNNFVEDCSLDVAMLNPRVTSFLLDHSIGVCSFQNPVSTVRS